MTARRRRPLRRRATEPAERGVQGTRHLRPRRGALPDRHRPARGPGRAAQGPGSRRLRDERRDDARRYTPAAPSRDRASDRRRDRARRADLVRRSRGARIPELSALDKGRGGGASRNPPGRRRVRLLGGREGGACGGRVRLGEPDGASSTSATAARPHSATRSRRSSSGPGGSRTASSTITTPAGRSSDSQGVSRRATRSTSAGRPRSRRADTGETRSSSWRRSSPSGTGTDGWMRRGPRCSKPCGPSRSRG